MGQMGMRPLPTPLQHGPGVLVPQRVTPIRPDVISCLYAHVCMHGQHTILPHVHTFIFLVFSC